jgi:hypothetical protein
LNWILKRTFRPKKDDIAENWRKLHTKELHNLYSSPNIITMLKSKEYEIGGVCSMRKGDLKCRILFEESEEKRPLERPKPRWEDNIKIYLMGNMVSVFGLDLSGS